MAAVTAVNVVAQWRLLGRLTAVTTCCLHSLRCHRYHSAVPSPRPVAHLSHLSTHPVSVFPPSTPTRLLSTLASELGSEEEVEEVREWRRSFTRDSVPYRTFDIHHARSSGAGGQNVNKGR